MLMRKSENRVAEIASGIVCGCLITMPHFFRHITPRIAGAFSPSRRSNGSCRGSNNNKLASFVPVRASKVPEWSEGLDTRANDRSEYMELGESNWPGPGTISVHVEESDIEHGKDDWGGRGPKSVSGMYLGHYLSR